MRPLLRNSIAAVFAVALSLIAPASQAETKIKLVMAASHSPKLPFVGLMGKYFKPEVEKRLKQAGSDIKIEWTEAYAGALYSFQYTLEAVQQNITDIGWVGTIWESSKMPMQQLTFVTPFVVDDVRTVIAAMNKLHSDLPTLRKEWEKQNQVYLGATGIGTYHLYTTFPVNSIDDLKGKKINGAGLVGAWLKGTGAVPVDGGIPIFYENVKNRIVDGVLLTAGTAYSIKLHEVAPYVTKIAIGAQYVGGLSVNLDRWKKFPPTLQKIMREVGLEYSRKVGEQTVTQDEAALKKMAAEGAKISSLASAEREKWIKLLPNLGGDWADAAEKRGNPARTLLKAYMADLRGKGLVPARDWDKQ